MGWNLVDNLIEVLESVNDPFCHITLVLEDETLTVNKMLFLMMTEFMKDILQNIDDTVIFVPHMSKKSFLGLLEVIYTGESSYKSKEEVDRLSEDIYAFGFGESTFQKVSKASPESKFTKTDERNIDRFEVQDKITCKFCLTQFSSNTACKNHEKICDKNPSSEEEPKFQCNDCESSFKTEAGLKTHKKLIHQSYGRHKCGSCEKEYKYEHDLKRHCKIHDHKYLNAKVLEETSSTAKFTCDDCDFSCTRKDSLLRHQRLVHSIHNLDFDTIKATCTNSVTYKCPKCKEKFETEKDIKTHMKLKNCKTLKCNICGKIFTLHSNLNRHKKDFHK